MKNLKEYLCQVAGNVKNAKALFLLATLVLLCGLSQAVTISPVHSTGSLKNRVNIVFLGDGYTEADIITGYTPWVNQVNNYFFKDSVMSYVYFRYQGFINSYRIDMPVAKSGIGWGTPLNAQLTCADWTIGQCYVDWAVTNGVIDSALKPMGIKANWRIVALNGSHRSAAHYARGGNLVTVFTVGDGNAPWTAFHEGGHAFHYLGDEYSEGWGKYLGNEAGLNFWLNLTTDSTGKKWARWLGHTSTTPGLGTVGVYNGGLQYDSGVYRPTFASMMGARGQLMPPFNVVAMEKMIHDIYAVVNPVDTFLTTKDTLANPDSLWLKLVDAKVTKVDWSVNGKVVDTVAGPVFNLRSYFWLPGTYKIKAWVYDEAVKYAFSNNANPHKLDLVRQGLDKLQKSYEWTVKLSPRKTDTVVVTTIVPRVDTLRLFRTDTLRILQTDTVRTLRVDTLHIKADTVFQVKKYIYQLKMTALLDSLVFPDVLP